MVQRIIIKTNKFKESSVQRDLIPSILKNLTQLKLTQKQRQLLEKEFARIEVDSIS